MASFFNLILDTTAPAGVTLALNDDARYTTKASITAKIGCEDAETTGYRRRGCLGQLRCDQGDYPLHWRWQEDHQGLRP